jgi:hypothetical protein
VGASLSGGEGDADDADDGESINIESCLGRSVASRLVLSLVQVVFTGHEATSGA